MLVIKRSYVFAFSKRMCLISRQHRWPEETLKVPGDWALPPGPGLLGPVTQTGHRLRERQPLLDSTGEGSPEGPSGPRGQPWGRCRSGRPSVSSPTQNPRWVDVRLGLRADPPPTPFPPPSSTGAEGHQSAGASAGLGPSGFPSLFPTGLPPPA